jgi:hypothetical protein
MFRLSFRVQHGLQQLDDAAAGETGFGGFAHSLAKELLRPIGLGVTAPIRRRLRDERSESLPAEDDPFALEFLVGAF